ncbi:MAG: DUF3644 domain-containing protein [Thainema sp.]
MKVVPSHKRFLEFLQKMETKGKTFSEDEILSASGWQKSTFRTYLNKGQLSDFLNKTGEGYFEASNSVGVSVQQFTQLLSQSKHRRGLGHNCESRLAKALLKKSRDNMLLALELYNRPSLENRMDGFVLCFCTAWEQLLKAIIIEDKGEEAIFKKNYNAKRIRETISLRDCLDKLYDTEDLVRKNIERITFYRDQAVHLLMPEVQGIMSRVFQSGVLNYSVRFQDFTEQTFISSAHSGMLSLVGDLKRPSIAALHSNYGKEIGNEVSSLIEDLTEEAKQTDDIQFAIPLNVRLVFARSDERGNTITLAQAEEGMEGLQKAIILEKPTDRAKTHPFRESAAIKEINTRLYNRYSVDVLEKKLIARERKTKEPVINTHCFRSVVAKLKWKNSNNRYHYENRDPETHYYSDFAVEEFIKKIMEIDGYLEKARSNKLTKTKNRR